MIRDLIQIGRIAVIFLTIVSCSFGTSELRGVYTAKNFTESIDTLRLDVNGIYYRSIHDKKSNKLIFRGTNNWDYRNGEIILNNFLSNPDGLKYYNDSVNFDDVLGTSYLTTKKNIFSGIKIIIHEDLNYYYAKVER